MTIFPGAFGRFRSLLPIDEIRSRSSPLSRAVAIDLGATHTRVFSDAGEELATLESVAAMDPHSGHIQDVGASSRALIGHESGQYTLVQPLRRGLPGAVDSLSDYLGSVLRKIGIKSVSRLRLALSVPIGISVMEREIIGDAVAELGAREVLLIPGPLAGALGCGLDVTAPEGKMVVVAGSSSLEAAIFSLGEPVSISSKFEGTSVLTARVTKYLLEEFSLVIATETAEEIVVNLLDLSTESRKRLADVWGRDSKSGATKNARVAEDDIYRLLSPLVDVLQSSVSFAIGSCQAELVADVSVSGIVLVGGAALLSGFGERLANNCGVAISTPSRPDQAVVRGLVAALDRQSRVLGNGMLDHGGKRWLAAPTP